jgi:hypothetical protein
MIKTCTETTVKYFIGEMNYLPGKGYLYRLSVEKDDKIIEAEGISLDSPQQARQMAETDIYLQLATVEGARGIDGLLADLRS